MLNLAMYNNDNWQYFNANETNGCEIEGISEAPNGEIWVSTRCGDYFTYAGEKWTLSSLASGQASSLFMFDDRSNLWYVAKYNNALTVRWNGVDYFFDTGQWLSDSQYQANYGFDANVLPGYYSLQIEGAVGNDGMPAYVSILGSFQVDFAFGVTLDPPLPPQVAAQTTGSLANLSAAWQTSSPNIDQYRYAIGTTPGARNVVGWTYLAGASFIRNDLNLVQGQSYYITVQARNTSGLWSVNGVSNGVIGGETRVYLPTISRF